jgi:hypothetical protein
MIEVALLVNVPSNNYILLLSWFELFHQSVLSQFLNRRTFQDFVSFLPKKVVSSSVSVWLQDEFISPLFLHKLYKLPYRFVGIFIKLGVED